MMVVIGKMMRDLSTTGDVDFDGVSKVVVMQDFASDNILLFELVPSANPVPAFEANPII